MPSLLKDTRERAGLAIEDVAFKLKIRRQYLIALEEEKLEEIPGEVYAQGYMKMYATYLGIEPEECKIFPSSNINNSFWSPNSEQLSYFGTKKITLSLLILGVLCIFSWHSLTEKINYNSDSLLINKLNEYTISEENEAELNLSSTNIETVLDSIPNVGSD